MENIFLYFNIMPLAVLNAKQVYRLKGFLVCRDPQISGLFFLSACT